MLKIQLDWSKTVGEKSETVFLRFYVFSPYDLALNF